MDIVGFLNAITGNNLLLWKVIAATIVFLLAGLQVFMAARLWGASGVPSMSTSAATKVHIWSGRVTLALAVLVAVSCIAGPAGPLSPTRVMLHSIFGTLLFVVLIAKFTILRVFKKGYALVPVLGTTLFGVFAALWATSVADYVSAR
jgi:hypothetical protein